ncbi:unnamed protein product [Scytosiphon promiscuus]
METPLQQLTSRPGAYGVAILVVYVAVIRLLRFRRVRGMKLSDVESDPSAVVRKTTLYEFPFTSQKAVEFLLIRSFGLPSASAVFFKSRSFVHPGKRYDDTDLLLKEYLENNTQSARANTSVARVNAIHAVFAKEISNADMLYVLALFATMPAVWIDRLEWRRCTDIEKAAFLAHYQTYGERLGIVGGREWKTWDDARAFAQAYEAEYYQHSEAAEELFGQNMNLLLCSVPLFLKPFGRKAVTVLMDPPLLKAFGLPEAPLPLKWFVNGVLSLRAMILLFLAPPRFFPLRCTPSSRGGDVPFGCPMAAPDGVSPETCEIPGDADVKRVPQNCQFHDVKQGCLFYKDGYQIKNVGTRKCPAGRLMWNDVPVFTGTGSGGSATNMSAKRTTAVAHGNVVSAETKKAA